MLMPQDWTLYEPQDRIGVAPDGALMEFLRSHRDAAVRVSLRHQNRPDSRVVQVLLVATHAWATRGLGFDVTGLSPRLQQDFARLGLTPALGWSGLA
jgi:anti-anti-sigma regulatory factor